MRRLITAIAAIALVAGTAHAQGNGKGNDRGGGKPPAAAQGGGQGGPKADRGNRGQGGGPAMAVSMRGSDNRGQGNAMREQRGNGNPERGNSARADAQRGNNERGNGQAARVDRGNDNRSERAVERRIERASDNRGRGNDDRVIVDLDRDDDRRGLVRVRDLDDLDRFAPRGLIDGCPPGLAKKNPPCVPPGLARNAERRLLWDRPDWWGLSWLDGDDRYFYDDGYLIRLDDDGDILGYVPLLGGALAVGNAWPDVYEPFGMPSYYERFYGLGPYPGYRYYDDVLYRVDPETAAITSIAALLTGDDFAVGQPMPLGYDVYNVPYAYRDRYVDGPDAYYRYADGYIYEVDPETRLIAAAIELLT